MSNDRSRVLREINGAVAFANVDATCINNGAVSAANLANTGSVAGRACVPVMIDWQQLSGVATYTAPTWTIGAYRALFLKVKGTSGSATGFGITLTGLGGTYKELGIYNEGNAPGTIAGIGSNTAWSVGMGALPWRIRGEFEIDTGGIRQGSLSTMNANGTAASRSLAYRLEFMNDDITSDVTGMVVSFTGGTVDVGSIELWGIPYIPASTTSLMFLGDSIGEGGPSGGYRRKIVTELWQYMPTGSLTTNPPLAPFPSDRIKHEGHGGFTSAQILANIATYWTANPAAYVTLLTGTNDATAGTPAATTGANIAATVDYINSRSPNTRIWVGHGLNQKSSLVAGNALIVAQSPVIQALAAARPSYVTAVRLPFLTDAQLDATVHPVDAAAYDIVANSWIAAMRIDGAN